MLIGGIVMWATRDAETLPPTIYRLTGMPAFIPLAVYIHEMQVNKTELLYHKNTVL